LPNSPFILSLKPFHPFNSSLPLRERTKVSGAVKFFPFHQPSPLAGEGQGEGALLKSFHLPSLLSTPRERLRVRGIFFQFFSPLAGENKSEGCR